MATVYDLDYSVYRLKLPSGEVEVTFTQSIYCYYGHRAFTSNLILKTCGATDQDLSDLRERLAQTFGVGWNHDRCSSSWRSSDHPWGKGTSCALLEALGPVELQASNGHDVWDEDDLAATHRMDARTHASTVRELWARAHEGMRCRSIEYALDPLDEFVLENPGVLKA